VPAPPSGRGPDRAVRGQIASFGSLGNPASPASDRGEVLLAVLADLGTDHRCFKLASSLKRLGYRPVLLCDRPLHTLGAAWEGMDIRILTPKSHYQGFLPAFLVFLLRLTPILLSTSSRLWISVDLPPLFWVALLGRLRGARVVYDGREIILETPMIRERPLRRLLWGLWHRAGLALADAMWVVGPTAEAWYRERHPGLRLLQLPNVPFGTEGNGEATSAAHAPESGKAALVFQGAMRWGTGLEDLLAALATDPGRGLTLFGFGPETDALKKLASAPGLADRVRFEGTVPFEALHARLTAFHIGVHLMKPALPGYDLTLANKIFDYAHAGLPVLLGPTSANRDLLARKRIGVEVADYSAGSILAAIAELERDWEAFRAACLGAAKEWRWEAFEGNIEAALEGRSGAGRTL
jgi:glycosyltransferase involved in cell wall biosynthesis